MALGGGPGGRGAWASTVRFGPVLKSVRHEGMIEQNQISLVLDWELNFDLYILSCPRLSVLIVRLTEAEKCLFGQPRSVWTVM